jgi:hypothetical protein
VLPDERGEPRGDLGERADAGGLGVAAVDELEVGTVRALHERDPPRGGDGRKRAESMAAVAQVMPGRQSP